MYWMCLRGKLEALLCYQLGGGEYTSWHHQKDAGVL